MMASFHAVYLPAMLIALEQPLPMQLLSHAHWTVERAKMSKSVGNVADPIKAIDDVGVDLVRYYLARVGGRFQDDVGRSSTPSPPFLHGAYFRNRIDASDVGLRQIGPKASS